MTTFYVAWSIKTTLILLCLIFYILALAITTRKILPQTLLFLGFGASCLTIIFIEECINVIYVIINIIFAYIIYKFIGDTSLLSRDTLLVALKEKNTLRNIFIWINICFMILSCISIAVFKLNPKLLILVLLNNIYYIAKWVNYRYQLEKS